MPWHLELDALSEAEKAKEGTAIGTTKKGIGPTYMDKSERSGIRMHDFVDAERFEEVIRETCARKNRVITGVYGGDRRGRCYRRVQGLRRPSASDGARHHRYDL